jgi:hypothetical protein
LQAENQRIRHAIQENYSFYFLAKDVADYTNTDYWTIMAKPAMEIFSLVEIMKAKGEMLKLE